MFTLASRLSIYILCTFVSRLQRMTLQCKKKTYFDQCWELQFLNYICMCKKLSSAKDQATMLFSSISSRIFSVIGTNDNSSCSLSALIHLQVPPIMMVGILVLQGRFSGPRSVFRLPWVQEASLGRFSFPA